MTTACQQPYSEETLPRMGRGGWWYLSEEGVDVNQELPHAGDESYLSDFPSGLQCCVVRLDDGVVSDPGEASHVQGRARTVATAPDKAFALLAAAVVVVGSDADQRCRFSPLAALRAASADELLAIDGVGPSIAASVVRGLSERATLIERLGALSSEVILAAEPLNILKDVGRNHGSCLGA